MSLFWDYFKNGLKWPLIRREGALSALVRGCASVLDDARELVLWLRSQFLIEQCIDAYVEPYAAGRAIREWYHLPGNVQSLRDLTRDAYLFYKRGGRASGVELVLELAGYHGEVVEGAEVNPPLPPYFFDVLMGEAPGAVFDELIELICAFKPARSWISSVRMPDCSGRLVLDFSELSRDCLSDVYGWLYGGVKWCFMRHGSGLSTVDEVWPSQARQCGRMYWMPVYSDWLDWSILDESLPLLNPIGMRYSLRPVDSVVDLPPSSTCWWRTFKCQQVLDDWGTLSGGEGFIDEWEYGAEAVGFPVLSDDEPPYSAPIIEFLWVERLETIGLETAIRVTIQKLSGGCTSYIVQSLEARNRAMVEAASTQEERGWYGEWDDYTVWGGNALIVRRLRSQW